VRVNRRGHRGTAAQGPWQKHGGRPRGERPAISPHDPLLQKSLADKFEADRHHGGTAPWVSVPQCHPCGPAELCSSAVAVDTNRRLRQRSGLTPEMIRL
jgi:hypothetical protein